MMKLFKGKGEAILHACEEGDLAGLEKIFHIKREDGEPLKVGKPQNIEVTNETGSTPLILASLQGHKEIVELLLEMSANVNAADSSGNNALHMAAWHGKADVVQVLIKGGANVNTKSVSGDTALHYAAQFGKPFVLLKLLQAGADPTIQNNKGDVALMLATKSNSKEAFSILLDTYNASDGKVIECLFDGAKMGRKEIVEIILDHGVNPNSTDGGGSTPLHDATQFFRTDVAHLLLDFGADPMVKNSDRVSPYDIADEYNRKKPNPLFDSYTWVRQNPSREVRKPAEQLIKKTRKLSVNEMANERARQASRRESQGGGGAAAAARSAAAAGAVGAGGRHPKLRNKVKWTRNSKKHCSAFEAEHPATAALDGKLDTYWRIPSGNNHYMLLDFGKPYTLTGIVMYVIRSPIAVCDFQLERGDSPDGPWQLAGNLYNTVVDLSGAAGEEEEELDEAKPTAQEFGGFEATAQYWKLTIKANHGSLSTVCHQFELRGFDAEVPSFLADIGLADYLPGLLSIGGNEVCEFWRFSEEQLEKAITLVGHRKKMVKAIAGMQGRPLTFLKWATPPANQGLNGKVLPPFVVHGTPGVSEEVVLIAHGGAMIGGTFTKELQPQGENPSVAVFDDVTLDPPGNYLFEVLSPRNPAIMVRQTAPIAIGLAHASQDQLDQAFGDLDDMLNCDF